MKNFEFYNPTRIIFGKGTIEKLRDHLPAGVKVMLCYGGGSIKRNGVYDQVMNAIENWEVVEFGGIEANPEYDTLLKAIEWGKAEGVGFILAVGGGSVIDGAKLIAAAIPFSGSPWDIVTEKYKVKIGEPLPLGTVLTLPATSSEMNHSSVISHRESDQKLVWRSEAMFPVFSILDPEVTYSLPEKQIRNGIVDAYIHVLEQYITYPMNAALQDRQAEAILLTLQDIAEGALQSPPDYDARANLMWTVSNSLNKLINKGVAEDWATHMIGHELTAFYGLDHAESLAVIIPHLYWYKREQKHDKLVQYGQRVWGLAGEPEVIIKEAIEKMRIFFNEIGMPTTLTAYEINPVEAAERIRVRFEQRGTVLGEHKDVTPEVVAEIVMMSVSKKGKNKKRGEEIE
jgi:NADP-dependent alcohol dehydrogenase